MQEGRITNKKVLQEIGDILNLKKGIPFTLWKIISRPASTIKDYLNGDRAKYVNSFRLLIVVVSISTFLYLQLDVADKLIESSSQANTADIENSDALAKTKAAQKIFGDLFTKYLSMLSFLIVPFLGVSTMWFFRKSELNLAEHITAQAQLNAATAALAIVIALPFAYFNQMIVMQLFGLVIMVYQIVWCLSIANTKSRKFRIISASIGSYVVGYLMYAFFIGMSIAVYALF